MHDLVELLDEVHRLQVLPPAELVGNPFPGVAGVVEVQHAGHRIHAQAVNVVHVGQEHRVGEQEGPDLVAPVVEDQGAPVAVLALARVGVLVQVRAVEVGQSVAVLGKMRGHPVQQHPDAFLVTAIHEILEVVRVAVARGDGIVADGLVAPRAVEGMLGQGQRLDVGEAQFLDVRDQGVGQFAVAQPAVVLLGHTPPRGQMHLVNADGLLHPVDLGPLLHPCLVFPRVLVVVPHHGGRARTQLGIERIGIGFLGQEIVLALDLKLVEIARLQLGNKQFPDPGGAAVLHGMMPPVPPIEHPDHADPHRIGRPHRKVHALHPFDLGGMRAHLFVGAIVRPLAKKILVKFRDLERETIGIEQLPHMAVKASHTQPVVKGRGLGQDQLEQPVLVGALHAQGGARSHHIHLGGKGLESTNDHARFVGVLSQHVKGRSVHSVNNGFNGTIRQRGLHRLPLLKPSRVIKLQRFMRRAFGSCIG